MGCERDGLEKFHPHLNEMLVKKQKAKAVSEMSFDNTSKYLTFQEEVREEQHQPMSQEERQRIAELIANRRDINTAIADGLAKAANGKYTGNGFLYEVGYTAIKDGPGTKGDSKFLQMYFMVK